MWLQAYLYQRRQAILGRTKADYGMEWEGFGDDKMKWIKNLLIKTFGKEASYINNYELLLDGFKDCVVYGRWFFGKFYIYGVGIDTETVNIDKGNDRKETD
jgi:hypothetical protein